MLAHRQGGELADRIGASVRGFRALDDEMLAEILHVFFAVEMMRREHDRKHRRAGFQLDLHQAVDDGRRDEIVAIDAAIDHEARRHDAGIAARLREAFGVQRNFEGARHFVQIDVVGAVAVLLDRLHEGMLGLIDDVAMPASLNESETRTLVGGCSDSLGFDGASGVHGLQPVLCEQGVERLRLSRNAKRRRPFCSLSSGL
ncbi:hypothetical protein PT2222_60233 [Paraburkholderia tropica]